MRLACAVHVAYMCRAWDICKIVQGAFGVSLRLKMALGHLQNCARSFLCVIALEDGSKMVPCLLLDAFNTRQQRFQVSKLLKQLRGGFDAHAFHPWDVVS